MSSPSVLPVGPPVTDGKTAQPPKSRLEGQYVTLQHLEPQDSESLWQHIKDDEDIWVYMLDGPYDSHESFHEAITEKSQSADPYIYSVVDKQAGEKREVIGYLSVMRLDPTHRVNEIGHILFSKKMRRTRAATEAIFLLMQTSFEDLHSRRVEWKTNSYNAPSRKAALRLGFQFEGIFRNHYIVKGHSRDTAWFSMIDSEWPAKKRGFQAWLHADNFDQQARQIKDLGAFFSEFGSS